METIIHSKLVTFLEENSMINNSQHGFHNKRSCLSLPAILKKKKKKIQLNAFFIPPSLILDFTCPYSSIDSNLRPWILKTFISRSKYVEPTLSEGFDDILKVNFIPEFKDETDQKLYRMFLLEK